MELEIGNVKSDFERWYKSFKRMQKSEYWSQNAIKAYERVLDKLKVYIDNRTDKKSIKELDREFFLDFLEHLEENSKTKRFSKQTRRNYVSILKSFFNYISDQNEDGDGTYGYEREFKKLAPKKKRNTDKVKSLTDEEREKILNQIELELDRTKHYTYITSLAVKVMLYGGLRASEALNLWLSDFTISDELNEKGERDQYSIRLRETKSGEIQHVNVLIDIIEEELEYFRGFLGPDDYIFKGLGSKNRIDRGNFYRKINSLMGRAGVNQKGLHIFRHTCAMVLYRKTRDVLVVQAHLRHADVSTTMVYANAQKSDVAQAIR